MCGWSLRSYEQSLLHKFEFDITFGFPPLQILLFLTDLQMGQNLFLNPLNARAEAPP